MANSAAALADVAGLRSWQREVVEKLARWQRGTFLIAAAPGAGKTRPALELAKLFLANGVIDRVMVVCPTAPLTRQWAAAANMSGLQLTPDAEGVELPYGFHGAAVTYARISMAPESWASIADARTLVIADEAHHLGEELSWGQTFMQAFGRADRWLLLSGTPFRSDSSAIPGVKYDSDGMATPDYSYSYAQAVADKVCRPVTFIPFDGTLSWQVGEETVTASFDDVVASEHRSKRYRTAISTELEGALPKILREANYRLMALRMREGKFGHPDAGGLVVAADSDHARAVAGVLQKITGEYPTVVMHTDSEAHEKLRQFTNGSQPWIVAVNMVSEGVDIPRLRVGVYATAAKTAMIFRQIVGRFVRTVQGRPIEPAWLYLPGEVTLKAHAGEIDRELVPFRRGPVDDVPYMSEDGLLDEPSEKAESHSLELEFKALEADMAAAAQLDLFGGAVAVDVDEDDAVTSTPQVTLGQVPVESVTASANAAAEVPLWEQRKRLRSERQMLVSELARSQASTQKEINAWVNAQVGLTNVGQATIGQLQRCIDLLEEKLAQG